MKLNELLGRSDGPCLTKQVRKFMRCKSFNSSNSLGNGRKMCARQPTRIVEQCNRIPTSCRFIHTSRCLYDSESPQDKEGNASGPQVIDYTVFTKKSHSKVLDDVEEQSQMQPEKSMENHKNHHQRKITKYSIASFLRKFIAAQETFKVKLKRTGMTDKSIWQATENFKTNLKQEITEDENLAYFIGKMDSKVDNNEGIFECFYNYVKQRYPLKENMKELKTLCDLTNVANWFVTARQMKRKVIFHAGPTNSGKTYHALNKYEESNSGIYGGPLRMLAAEVYARTNGNGIPCDMLTGEQRLYAKSEFEPSDHVSCTVEMYKIGQEYDCAVIDEIQLLRDRERGWGWTNAFLGIQAKEVHLCGEPAAEKLIRSLVKSTGDELEVRKYKRLTPLHLQKKSLGTLKAVRPGDCVVAFSRQKIFNIRAEIEKTTKLKCSVIYGGLPPPIRLEQARRFNDPDDEHKVLIASDAIGMGLNLSIRRLIFNSLQKFDGRRMIVLPSYHAKQIAGRAGRYGTDYPEGFVTTLHAGDLAPLSKMLTSKTDDVQQAGLRPQYEQIEMLSHVLPKATLTELLDTFVRVATMDGNYFMCDIEHTKSVSEAIQHIPMSLRQRYHLCSAATDRTNKSPLITRTVIKIATLFSKGKAVGPEELKDILGWPRRKPRSSEELLELETIHDIFDLHLWMSYKYEEIFIGRETVRELQVEVENLIQTGVDVVFNVDKKTAKWRKLFR